MFSPFTFHTTFMLENGGLFNWNVFAENSSHHQWSSFTLNSGQFEAEVGSGAAVQVVRTSREYHKNENLEAFWTCLRK